MQACRDRCRLAILEIIMIGSLWVGRRGAPSKVGFDHVGDDGARLGEVEGGDSRIHLVETFAAEWDNERSGVLSTAMSFLGLYRDPVVAQVACRCDWRIADLVADERPATLYLVVPPSDISRTKPLIRLLLNQIGRR